MTVPTRPGPQFADLVRRLWAWNVSSWGHGDRIEVAHAALGRLAVLTSQHDGLARPQVPDAGPHALIDQLVVLVGDAWDAGVPGETIETLIAQLAIDLKLR